LPIDPNANAAYRKANDVLFAVGQHVWVTGIEFRVVGITPVSPQVPNGQLILAPVTAKV
jgi:hypothetical protein